MSLLSFVCMCVVFRVLIVVSFFECGGFGGG